MVKSRGRVKAHCSPSTRDKSPAGQDQFPAWARSASVRVSLPNENDSKWYHLAFLSRLSPLSPRGNKRPNSAPRDTNLASASISSRSSFEWLRTTFTSLGRHRHLQYCLGDPLGDAVCIKQVEPGAAASKTVKIQVGVTSRPSESVLLLVPLCRLGLSLLLFRLLITCRGIFGC